MTKKAILNVSLMISIFLLVILSLGTQQAIAGDVSFSDGNTIEVDFNGACSVYAADIDGDGDLDILGASDLSDDITWWENTTGNGTAWTRHNVNDNFNGARSVYAADIDDDGDMDVLGAAVYEDSVTWWENTAGDGTDWTRYDVNTGFDGVQSVYAADIDGDGDMDVLGAAIRDDDITWWENTDSNGTAWTRHDVNGNFTGARDVYAADVDGDGDIDVLGAAYTADEITWWENTDSNGTVWTRHDVNDNFDGACSVYAADIDGDGDIDVLGAALVSNDITWWENTNSNGTAWTRHDVNDNFSGVENVYAADMDGDGDIDVLAAALIANDITWWENTTGNGTDWTRHDVNDNFDGAYDVYPADIDNDGDLDVLGAAYYANNITWWRSNLAIPGDVEPDGDVDLLDYAVLAAHWLDTGCEPGACGRADLTGDGNVDYYDLKQIKDNWLAGK